MSRCIELGKKGLGSTYPNPLVGCVIVHDGKIIGEGWHRKAGEPHAEVHAIQNATNAELLPQATLYVNLEPCSHFGKTPPCADLIISKGIKKVVIGTSDPNPTVSGRGIARLKEAGCEVTVGVLQEKCEELNKRFFRFQKEHRPYIILKWAQSRDGFLAPLERDKKKEPVWITNEFSRQFVHKMRTQEAAILVGTNTVLEDNPSLTARSWKGASPYRIVLDRSNRIPDDAVVLDGSVPTLVISNSIQKNGENLNYERIDFSKPVGKQICALLFQYELQSLIVEGGARTLQTFIDEDLWDEVFIFKGAVLFDEGIGAPEISGTMISEKHIEDDIVQHLKNQSS